MQLEIRLFAMLREAAGQDRLAIDVPAGTTVGGLKAAIAETYPALADFVPATRVAVALAFVADEYALSAPAEIALIPPVSGG